MHGLLEEKTKSLRSLKSKILYYILLFAIIPLVFVSSVLIFQMYESKKLSIHEKHSLILEHIKNESDNLIVSIEKIAKYITINYKDKNSNVLNTIVDLKSNISSIIVLNNKGSVVNFSSREKLNIFKGFDYSNKSSFKKIKDGNNDYWSNVYLSFGSLVPSISYSFKINEKEIAIVIVDLKVFNTFLNNFMKESNIKTISLIDNNGVLLAYPKNTSLVSQRETMFNTQLYKKYILNKHINKQLRYDYFDSKNIIGMYGQTNKLHWYIVIGDSSEEVFKSFVTLMIEVVLFVLLILFLVVYISIRFSKSILEPLDSISFNMQNISHNGNIKSLGKSNLKEINSLSKSFTIMQNKLKARDKQVQEEIEKNKFKDIQLFEQSKMAAMGEMIGNIAHQWRQPLSLISTCATGMQLEKEYDKLTDERFIKACEDINDNVQYLSQTIDDFRNFIKGDRILQKINLSEIIKGFITLVNASAKNNDINIILSLKDDIVCSCYANELKQCLMNLFNNAKDVLLLQKNDRFIFIETSQTKEYVTITIKDNGGGIEENIINKIFEPYFTTKHKNKGTGLGLHMTYNLVVEGMKGTIVASNTTFTYEDIMYTGAMFTLSIPKNIS